jgi:hypothetical protein
MSDIAGIDAVNPNASADTVAAAVVNNAETLQRGSTILLIGLFSLVWFLTYLPDRLQPADGPGWPARTATASGLVVAGLMALIAAYVRSVTHTPITGGDAIIVKGVAYYDWDYLRTLSPFVSASLAGIGLTGLTARSLPKLMAWLCLVPAALPIILPPGFAAALYFLVLACLAAFLTIRPTVKATHQPVARR